MCRLRKKLRAQLGAAMVLALLFLLFCTTIGILTLSAASVNAGKLSRMRQEQQSYLAVRSAAQAFEDLIEDLEFSGNYTYRHTKWKETVTDSSGNPSDILHEPERRYYSQSGSFSHPGLQALAGDRVENLFFFALGDSTADGLLSEEPFIFDLELNTGIPDYPTVYAELQISVKETDRFSIVLTLYDQWDEGNPMTLTFLAKPPLPAHSEGTPPPGTEIPGGSNITVEIDETFDYSYSISWEPGILERGS